MNKTDRDVCRQWQIGYCSIFYKYLLTDFYLVEKTSGGGQDYVNWSADNDG